MHGDVKLINVTLRPYTPVHIWDGSEELVKVEGEEAKVLEPKSIEEIEEELIIRPASFIPILLSVPTPEQQREIEEKLSQGYKLVASSYLGGVQSRELRSAIGKRVIVYFRNGSRLEGRLKGFDRFTLRMRNYRGNILVYKHAISTIVYKP